MNNLDLVKFFNRLEELLKINRFNGYDLSNTEIISEFLKKKPDI
jgi:hypothetical protein